MDKALIISCSGKKCLDRGAAINLYDGNMFHILRRWKPRVDVFILSAKYGLIPAHKEIEAYDLTIDRSTLTIADISRQWKELELSNYKKIYICMSESYTSVLVPTIHDYLGGLKAVCLIGDGKGIGVKMAFLKKFCLRNQNTLTVPAWHKVVK
jgi:hypothetical protein